MALLEFRILRKKKRKQGISFNYYINVSVGLFGYNFFLVPAVSFRGNAFSCGGKFRNGTPRKRPPANSLRPRRRGNADN